MTALAPTLEAFFVERLGSQRHASPNTIASYRDSFRLLLNFAQQATGIAPAKLQIEMLDAPLIGAFLDHLERQRQVAVTTRNARLAAVHSLFSFAALRHPEHAGLIQRVLAIPAKRGDHPDISYLTGSEIEALLAAPDTTTRIGRRDRALLLVAVQTGLRVSELIGLRRQDVTLGAGAHVTCVGKGRKQRSTPLRIQTVTMLRDWLDECGGQATHCFRGLTANVSAGTPSGASSIGTPPPLHPPAPPLLPSGSRRTCSGTVAPCSCWTQEWTVRSSRSGSVTNRSGRPTYISTRISA